MALRRFETEDAEYFLGLGFHLASSRKIFRSIDFSTIDLMVFEDVNDPPDMLQWGLQYDRQYKELYKKIIKENPKIGVYGVETHPSKELTMAFIFAEGALGCAGVYYSYKAGKKLVKEGKDMSRREFLKNAGIIGGGVVLSSTMLSLPNGLMAEGEIPWVAELNNLRTNILPTPGIGFRDAVAAKKVSDYLVPKYKKKGRKTRVAMIYGALHSGIETKLKRPWIADATLWLYHSFLDYGKKKDLNQIRQVVRSKCGGMYTVLHDAKLF